MILCCMRDFVTNIFIIYSCMMSTFDCILSLWFCHEHMYSIQLCAVYLWLYVVCVLLHVYMYSIQLCAVNLCMFLLICNLYNACYVLMLIIILYIISLVLNHLLKPIQCVNNESASIPYVHVLYLETKTWNKRVRLEALRMVNLGTVDGLEQHHSYIL